MVICPRCRRLERSWDIHSEDFLGCWRVYRSASIYMDTYGDVGDLL